MRQIEKKFLFMREIEGILFVIGLGIFRPRYSYIVALDSHFAFVSLKSAAESGISTIWNFL